MIIWQVPSQHLEKENTVSVKGHSIHTTACSGETRTTSIFKSIINAIIWTLCSLSKKSAGVLMIIARTTRNRWICRDLRAGALPVPCSIPEYQPKDAANLQNPASTEPQQVTSLVHSLTVPTIDLLRAPTLIVSPDATASRCSVISSSAQSSRYSLAQPKSVRIRCPDGCSSTFSGFTSLWTWSGARRERL